MCTVAHVVLVASEVLLVPAGRVSKATARQPLVSTWAWSVLKPQLSCCRGGTEYARSGTAGARRSADTMARHSSYIAQVSFT